jgi:hypothetical protein
MFRLSCSGLLAGLLGLNLAAQTQVDLRTQSKGVDFQAAPYTRPLKTSAALPATCTANELLLLTTAPPGNNIYACLTPNVWTPQAGASSQLVIIQNGGTLVGSRGTENFVSGPGILNAITDLGTKINIQQGIDTSVVLAQADLQAGQTLFCQSSSGSGSTYSCALAPTLTVYTTGMVLFWKPDVNGAGGATTLNVDLLGATALVKPDGTNPGTTDIAAGELYPIWYDGTSFRLLNSAAASGGGGGGGSPPSAITSTNAGGVTAITAASEWHSPLAYCSGPSTATLIWNTPPAAATAAAAAGCAGTNVNDAYAAFAGSGTPSLQTSFSLPLTLTGNADVYITYLTASAGGTFTPALDVACTPANAAATDDPVFIANNFFAPGATIAPSSANTLGTASAQGLSWPAGCAAGSRAHFRLIRTDTSGTAANVAIAEVIVVLRRVL